MKKFLIFLLAVAALGLAEKGRINVITDLPSSEIYIDGVLAGREAVQNYEVDPGDHYVVVNYRGKKIYARTHHVGDGEIRTVPTAHFVDFKTNVANRGAVDVEAARIRETRGNFGLGAQASALTSTASLGGVSAKWWFTERWGLQAFGWLNNSRAYFGGRLLYWLADKVVFNAPFSGYLYGGGGTDSHSDQDNPDNNVRTTVSNGGFGVEFSPLGVNGLFLGLEIGLEKRYSVGPTIEGKDRDNAGMLFSGGLHLYF
ncbi:hypothetical protein NO2_0970 [Candidatus Termititenax persephonae]|uniref:PEGA domain-containing protein n=1 Tax=Candidatus Termititenax persephonae TaxID=2218525 RepID=A0A388TH04_9BACT|nr:hypothetical protein NO2_0970 [Candidatus Termititenax persephonae]